MGGREQAKTKGSSYARGEGLKGTWARELQTTLPRKSITQTAAQHQRKAGCVRIARQLPQAASLSEGCFLLDWNRASRDEMGDKRKMDFFFTFRVEPERKRR